MKTELTVYPAKFTYFENTNDNYFVIQFIDFPSCITQANSLQEAFYMAQDALGLYLEEEINFPNPTTDFSNIELEKNEFINYIAIDLDEYRKKFNNKSMNKTLTLPIWLNTLSEKNNINFSQVLQEALKKELNID